jgi:hypothetical protein
MQVRAIMLGLVVSTSAMWGSSFTALAQKSPPLPPNSLDCNAFTKNPDGSWTAHDDAKPLDIDGNTQTNVAGSTITDGSTDLYQLLETICDAATGQKK